MNVDFLEHDSGTMLECDPVTDCITDAVTDGHC